MAAKDDDNGHWVLDRRVPLALILTLLFQTGGALWWAASATARLEQVEKRVELTSPQAEKIVRLEATLEAIRESLAEVKSLLRQRRSEGPQ